MYRFRKDGISVLTVIDRRRRKNNGLYPVKIEVVYRRVQKYYPTGIDVSICEWEGLWRSRRISGKCSSLENSFHIVRNAVERLAEKGEFSFSRLSQYLGRGGDSVNEALKSRMNHLLKADRINSFYRFRSTLHAIERFAGKKITFESVTPLWLKKCESFWMREGKNSTTVNIYMKTLQSVFNKALEDGAIKEGTYPFGKCRYRIPGGESRKLALSKEQIESIRSWSGNHETEYWRDLWLFSYLCNGINFRDMLFLKYKNIKDGEIAFIREKTRHATKGAKVIRAALTPLMKDIMARSGNGADGESENFIFRHAKGKESPLEIAAIVRKAIASCNAAMKSLAKELGIPPFSTYAARHSFATILKRSGTDITYIAESLGHSSITMTERYLSGYGKEDRCEYAKILIGN